LAATVNNGVDEDFPRRGEVWMIETPNQPDDPHQLRPGLIVSDDDRNRHADDVITVPVFTSRRLGPTRVAIRAGIGGIMHDSMLYCDEVVTLHRRFLVEGPIGPPVSRSLLGRVNRAIRRALGEVVPEPS
jgi:mRNA-degrading endonuclease toxin of MazEF toxin-antitoxin module